MLAPLRDDARASARFGEAISAEVNRRKALGFYVIRSEAGRPGDFSDLTDEQLAEKLRAYETLERWWYQGLRISCLILLRF